MSTRSDDQKLAEFRARTDQQLHTLVSSRLDRGLSFAKLMLDEEAREHWCGMEEWVAKAEKSYNEAARLLPLLRGIPPAERLRLESRLAEIRGILDCATLCAAPRVQAAAML